MIWFQDWQKQKCQWAPECSCSLSPSIFSTFTQQLAFLTNSCPRPILRWLMKPQRLPSHSSTLVVRRVCLLSCMVAMPLIIQLLLLDFDFSISSHNRKRSHAYINSSVLLFIVVLLPWFYSDWYTCQHIFIQVKVMVLMLSSNKIFFI